MLAIAMLSGVVVLGGCVTNGDFGRVRPALVRDDMHDWVGREAVGSIGGLPSDFRLTDDERTLRDLAFALIEPPYDRNRWDSVWREYGLGRPPPGEAVRFNQTTYWARLNETYRRSEASAYAQLNTDARNDVVRIDPFFRVAARVVDMDRKRAQALGHVRGLSEAEHDHALRRNNENLAVIAWTCRALKQRSLSYRYALGRLAISTPSAAAAEVDRSINHLQAHVGANCRVGPKGQAVAKD